MPVEVSILGFFAPTLLMRLTSEQMSAAIRERDLELYATLMTNIARELGRRLRVADRLIARTSAAVAKQYVLESRRPPEPPKS